MQLTDYQSRKDFAQSQANIIALHDLTQKVMGPNAPGANTPQGQANRQALAMVGQMGGVQNARLLDNVAAKKASFDQMMQGGDQNDPSTQLRAMQIKGFITPQQYEQGNKELSSAQEAEKLRSGLLGSFNYLNNSSFGGAFSPANRSSAIDSYSGRLAHLLGEKGGEMAKTQIEAVLPGKLEGAQTAQDKLARLHSLVDGLKNTPTLNGLGISVPRSEAPLASQMAQTQTKGGKQYVRQGNYMVPVPQTASR
jgi:hypothetical protein